METIEVPITFGNGVSSAERLTDDPLKTTFVSGSTEGLDELTTSKSVSGSVSWSLIVKGIATDVFMLMV